MDKEYINPETSDNEENQILVLKGEDRMYNCTYSGCKKSYRKPSILRAHFKTHIGQKSFKCTYNGCEKAYYRKDHLDRHILAHQIHNKRSDKENESNEIAGFQCPIQGCKRSFVYEHYINQHIKTFHEAKEFKCTWPNCNEAFTKRNKLNRHICKHQGLLPHPCTIDGCDRRFNTPSLLKNHLLSHTDTHYYLCSTQGCNSRFQKWSELVSHNRKKHPAVCHVCNRLFHSRSLLKSHVKTHFRGFEGPTNMGIKKVILFKCPQAECNSEFGQKKNLTEHLKAVHLSSSVELSCPIPECGLSFPSKGRLNMHIRRKHPKSLSQLEGSITCPVINCNHILLSKNRLTHHLVHHHKIIRGLEDVERRNEEIRNNENEIKETDNHSSTQTQSGESDNDFDGNLNDDTNRLNEDENKVELILNTLGISDAKKEYLKRKYKCPKHDCQYRFDRLSALEHHIFKSHNIPKSTNEPCFEGLTTKRARYKLDKQNTNNEELEKIEEAVHFLTFRKNIEDLSTVSALEYTVLGASKAGKMDENEPQDAFKFDTLDKNGHKETYNLNDLDEKSRANDFLDKTNTGNSQQIVEEMESESYNSGNEPSLEEQLFSPLTEKSIEELEADPINLGDGKFRCKVDGCNKTYQNKSSWYRHMKNAHCDNETQGSSSPNSLHFRKQENKAKYKCTEPGCDKSYSRKATLNRHVKDFHW